MNNELEALLKRESELLEQFVSLTRQQHEILTAPQIEENKLLQSLANRRQVLEEFEKVFAALAEIEEAAPSRENIIAALEALRGLDAQNIELCSRHMGEISAQAKQMTQNRKVVTGYNRAGEGAAQTSGFFDERQ